MKTTTGILLSVFVAAFAVGGPRYTVYEVSTTAYTDFECADVGPLLSDCWTAGQTRFCSYAGAIIDTTGPLSGTRSLGCVNNCFSDEDDCEVLIQFDPPVSFVYVVVPDGDVEHASMECYGYTVSRHGTQTPHEQDAIRYGHNLQVYGGVYWTYCKVQHASIDEIQVGEY